MQENNYVKKDMMIRWLTFGMGLAVILSSGLNFLMREYAFPRERGLLLEQKVDYLLRGIDKVAMRQEIVLNEIRGNALNIEGLKRDVQQVNEFGSSAIRKLRDVEKRLRKEEKGTREWEEPM